MLRRDLADVWIHAFCPKPAVQLRLLDHFRQAAKWRQNCSCILGADLTKHGKPCLLYSLSDELFVFELTPEQAIRLDAQADTMLCARGQPFHTCTTAREPSIILEDVSLCSKTLNRTAPICGTFHYQATQRFREPLFVQVSCAPFGHGSFSHYNCFFQMLTLRGTVMFTLAPLGDLRDAEGLPFTGVAPLFFQLVTIWPGTSNNTQRHPRDIQSICDSKWPDWQLNRPGGLVETTNPENASDIQTSLKPPAANAFHYAGASASTGRAVSDIRAILVEIA